MTVGRPRIRGFVRKPHMWAAMPSTFDARCIRVGGRQEHVALGLLGQSLDGDGVPSATSADPEQSHPVPSGCDGGEGGELSVGRSGAVDVVTHTRHLGNDECPRTAVGVDQLEVPRCRDRCELCCVVPAVGL